MTVDIKWVLAGAALFLGVPAGQTVISSSSLGELGNEFARFSAAHEARLSVVETFIEKSGTAQEKIANALSARDAELRRELSELRKRVDENYNRLELRTRPVGLVDVLSEKIQQLELQVASLKRLQAGQN